MADKTNLTKSLHDLEEIAEWFDSQEAVDVEVGLTKVKQAAKLIKQSKARLAEIENEFQEIQKEISDEPVEPATDTPVKLDDIPF